MLAAFRRHRLPWAATAMALAVSLSACSSSDGSDAVDPDAPTTLDASAITVTPEAAREVVETATTDPSLTTPTEPLSPDDEAAVRQAVVDYHDAVAESFDPIDPESAALRQATTPAYFESTAGLLQSLLASGRTAESDYSAEIIAVTALAEDTARVDLCEIDKTVLFDAQGTSIGAPPDGEVQASFVVLLRNEAGEWQVDGGGLDDTDRRCP